MSRSAVAATLACAFALAGPLAAQFSNQRWRPEDRTVIGPFNDIVGLASSFQELYIVSPGGVLIWNQGLQEWRGPFEPPSPGFLSDVFGALADPIDGSLWLGTGTGWIQFDPGIRFWNAGTIPDRVMQIAFDRADAVSGFYLRGSQGWYRVDRGSTIATPSPAPRDPVVPLTAEQAMRLNPALRANSAAILTLPGMDQARYSVAAEAANGQGWYIGTIGAGLLYLPPAAAIPERINYGLPGPEPGPLYRAPGGVWVATDETRFGLAAITFVAERLDRFQTLHGSPAFGLKFRRATDMTGYQQDLWLATDLGIVRVPTDGGSVEVFDESRGVPDRRVRQVTANRGRVVAATARGLVWLDDSLQVRRLAPGWAQPVYSVAVFNDTVWAGTDLGIRYTVFDDQRVDGPLSMPAGLSASARLRAPVLDIALMADTLVAMTRSELLWRDPANGEWSAGPDLSVTLGGLRRMALDGGYLWVAGDRALGFVSLERGALRLLRPGDDLPAPPRDLVVQGDFLWVTTAAGLVRWRLRAIRP